MPKEVALELVQEMQFRLETGSGHQIVIDHRFDVGDAGAGPRPMELQLGALAGCAAMDVVSILRKMRQEITAYGVTATGETAAEHPRRYTSILVTHRLRGSGIVEAQVRRAIFLSMSQYCPVFAMLSPTVPISVRYVIQDDDAGGAEVAGEVTLDGDVEPSQ